MNPIAIRQNDTRDAQARANAREQEQAFQCANHLGPKVVGETPRIIDVCAYGSTGREWQHLGSVCANCVDVLFTGIWRRCTHPRGEHPDLERADTWKGIRKTRVPWS